MPIFFSDFYLATLLAGIPVFIALAFSALLYTQLHCNIPTS